MLPFLAMGQADQVDSILSLPEDTNKVFALSDLGYSYRIVDVDSALLFGERALSLAEELDYPRGIAQAYNDMSITLMGMNEYGTAINYLNIALAIREELRDTMGMGAIYNKLANIHQEQFKLEEALEYNFKALAIYESSDIPRYHAFILNNIGVIQSNLRKYNNAIRTHKKALEIRQKIEDEYGMASSYGNLANCFLYISDTSNAILNYEKAIEHFRSTGEKEELAIQLHNLAGVYAASDEAEMALEFFLEAYDLRTEINDRKAIASTLAGLGKTYLILGKHVEARSALQRSLRISREIDTRSEIMSGYELLARLYGAMNIGDSTVYYFDCYTALRDSVFNDDLSDRTAEMQTKYETAKKEKQNLALEVKLTRQRILMIVLGGMFLLIVLVGGFVFYSNKQKEKQRINTAIIGQKEKGLKAVLHAQEDERRRIARELHDSVGQTLSAVKMAWQVLLADLKGMSGEQEQKMDHTTKLLDEASTEVRNISHQMMPRALQEAGLVPALQDLLDSALGHSSIKYTLEQHNAETRFPEEIEIGIYRVCQELLNNVIKHSGASEVSVQLIRSGKNLVLIVEDNGKGFGSQDKKEGIGLLNIRSRMETVHGEVNFEPSPGSGTVATIRVPVE